MSLSWARSARLWISGWSRQFLGLGSRSLALTRLSSLIRSLIFMLLVSPLLAAVVAVSRRYDEASGAHHIAPSSAKHSSAPAVRTIRAICVSFIGGLPLFALSISQCDTCCQCNYQTMH